MAGLITLDAFLEAYAGSDPTRTAVARTVDRIAAASREVRDVIRQGGLSRAFAGVRGNANAGGDIQRNLDVEADEVFVKALRAAPVAFYASEELDSPVTLDPGAPLAVAVDPLDGSSNIETNVSIGTIFSILPAGADENPAARFLQPGTSQLAAGFIVYGPQMALVLTVGAGTHLFVFHPRLDAYHRSVEGVRIPPQTAEFAINASNYRHWDDGVRLYIDDCLAGEEGPREKNFNMRWIASLVADAYRIFTRGGVFLYPADSRRNYHHGRLRLVYEANPIAMLVEQAGGAATDTVNRILAIMPTSLHQRVPVVFGSRKEVERIARYHTEPSAIGERSPLFGKRSLFRA